MNAPMLVLAAILITAAVISHHEAARLTADTKEKQAASEKHHILQRLSVGMSGAAAFLLLWSVAPEITAIWLFLGTTWGIGVVVVVAMLTAWGVYHILWRGVKYRLEGTYFVVLLAAIDLGLIVGGWPAFSAGGSTLLSQAWNQSGHVASGETARQAISAARHASRSTADGSGWAVAAVIGTALILFFLWLRSHRRHRSEQQAAIGTGRPGLARG